MKKFAAAFAILVSLSACNYVNLKPNSLDKSEKIYAMDRGGYTIRFAAKQELENRGYKVVVGKVTNNFNGENFDLVSADTMGARYVMKIQEQPQRFSPVICLFGGFWWWRFNVSIADQKTGEELLAWTGRGCANGNLRRLNRIMDKLEK